MSGHGIDFFAWCIAQAWAMELRHLYAYARTVHGWQRSDALAPEVRAAIAAGKEAQRARSGGRGSIAVIPICGPIVQKVGVMTELCGGTSTEQIGAALRQALDDETIEAIILDVDSPGGSCYGLQQLADEINAAAKVKPLFGVANSLAASAAYWLLSQCSECYLAPGGECGSIGVYVAHEDYSKALEAAGVNTTLISSGKYKTEGAPTAPLPPEGRAFLQSRTDEYYGAFTRAVARGRGVNVETVRNGMGQGRVLGAADAVRERMVDGVATLGQVVQRARSGKRQAASAPSALAGSRGPNLLNAERRLQILELS